jgi:hypothetical protein
MKVIRVFYTNPEPENNGRIIGRGETEPEAVKDTLENGFQCNAGPLAIRSLKRFSTLSERVSDAFGGDAYITIADE